MVKIFLLNAPPLKKIGIVGQIYPPLGILYLASYAEKKIPNKLEFKALDGYQHSLAEVIDAIIEYKPDILGVSFTTQAATGAYEVILKVKQILKNTLVVCGGAHSTILPDEVLNSSNADIVVVGEGEETFYNVVKNYVEKENLDSIDGTVVKSNGEIKRNKNRPLIQNLDDVPFPARDLIDISKYPGYHYKKKPHDTSIVSARGCPFNCTYCSNPVWKLQKPWFRVRSPENVVDEMVYLKEKYHIHEFYDETDEFNGKLAWAKKVCDEIVKRDIKISWKVQMRADNVDDELAEKMKQSGCWLVFFGIETGNDRTSKGVNKNISQEQVIKALQTFKKYKIKTFALLMAFNVWEEEGKLVYEGINETKNTLNFAKRLVKDRLVDIISWSLTTPYPGSELYHIAGRHNLIDKEIIGKWDNFDSSANFVMKLPNVSDDDWFYIQREGKKMQALLLFKSGTFNWRSIPIYIKKLLFLVGKIVKR
jgi:radical SAM superfamily enzyme YgiQ (UPF0313 family)